MNLFVESVIDFDSLGSSMIILPVSLIGHKESEVRLGNCLWRVSSTGALVNKLSAPNLTNMSEESRRRVL